MHDLETFDTRPSAAIISIGAVMIVEGKIEHEFKQNVDLRSSLDSGLTESAATRSWWEKQHPAAKMVFTETIPLGDALRNYAQWIVDSSQPFGSVDGVWGNGSDFDNVILTSAFNTCGLPTPWKFFDSRCFRTIKSLFPVEHKFEGTKHDALDDARNQAMHLIEICKTYGFEWL